MSQDKTLTEEYLKNRELQIQQIAEEFGREMDASLLAAIKEEYEEVLKRPSSKVFPRDILFKKALGSLCAKIGKERGGERFRVYIVAYTEPTDWNEAMREEILKAWQSGPKAQQVLREQGKVATVPSQDGKIVVSEIIKYHITRDSRQFVPIAGNEIQEGELPIPIDTREKLDDGRDNRNYTFPLAANWSLNAFGLVELEKGLLPFQLSVYGDMAEPSHADFLPKKAPAFDVYQIVASVNDDKTDENGYFLQYLKAAKKDEENSYDYPEQIVYDLLENGFLVSYKKVKGQTDKCSPKAIYMVELEDLVDFHNEVMAKKDENGNRTKTPSGYDQVYYDRIGVGVYQCSDMTETKKGNFKIDFYDWTTKSSSLFTPDYMEKPEMDSFPQDVLISFRTSKKPTRWDRENKVSVKDPINGDVTLGNLMGIKVLRAG